MQRSMAGIQSEVTKSRTSLEGITTSMRGVAAAVGVSFGINSVVNFGKAIAQAGDQTQQLKAKLNLSFGQGGFEQARKSADALGVSTVAAAGTMSRLSNALKEFGASNQQIVGITETLVQMGRIAGSTGQEIESALTQFSQGLAKGRLDGDELKSVLEAMPPLGRLLADSMGVAVGELRDLGAQGKITSDVIIKAFEEGGGEIRKQFESLPESLDQATARMSNAFQGMLSAFDKNLQASGFYKFFSSQIAESFSMIEARLNVAGPVGRRGDAFNELKAAETRLAELRAAPVQGLATGLGIAEEEKKIAALRAEVDRLGESIKETNALGGLHAIQDRREGATPIGANISPQSIYPTRTLDDEKALAGYRADARQATEQSTKAWKAANDDRIADAKRTKDELDQLAKEEADTRASIREKTQTQELAQIEYLRERKSKDAKEWFDESQRLYKEYQNGVTRQANEAVEAQADILLEPWRNMASRVSTLMGDTIDQWVFDWENVDLSGVSDSISQMFRTTLSGMAGNLITQPLLESVDTLRKGGVGALTQDPYLMGGTGIAGGFVASSVANQALGLKGKYGGVGSAIGGLGGAGLGFALGGPIGAGVGGFVGSTAGGVLGGLFGGGGLGNDRSAQNYSTGPGRLSYSDSSFSEANRSITGTIAGQLQSLQESLAGLGARFDGRTIALQAGNKTGIQVDGQGYGSPEEALQGAIRSLLGGSAGLSGARSTALRNTQGRSAQEVLSDVDFARTFEDMTFRGTEAKRVIRDLNEQFVAASRRAAQLGLDTGALAKAQAEAVAEVRKAAAQQRKALDRQLNAAISGDETFAAVAGVRQTFEQLISSAREAGHGVGVINALYKAQAREIANVQRAEQQQRKALNRQIDTALSGNETFTAVAGVEQAFTQLIDSAREAGHGVGVINALYNAQVREIAEIQKAEQQRRNALNRQIDTAISGNETAVAISGVEQSFAQLISSAQEAGHGVDVINALYNAQTREIAQLQKAEQQRLNELNRQIDAAISDSDALTALAGINQAFDQLRDSAEAAGHNVETLATLEKARVREQQQLAEQYTKQGADLNKQLAIQATGVQDFFAGLIEPLQAAVANQNTRLAPLGQIETARRSFQEQLGRAQDGDVKALQALPGAAQALQGLSAQFLGSGGRGAEIAREVAAGLNSVIGDLQRQQAEAMISFPDVVRETISEAIRQAKIDKDELVEAIRRVERELGNLRQAA